MTEEKEKKNWVNNILDKATQEVNSWPSWMQEGRVRVSTGKETKKEEKEDRLFIKLESSIPGYAHSRLQGTCGPDVTAGMIMDKFYDPYFGGRNAWVGGGRWGCIVHND